MLLGGVLFSVFGYGIAIGGGALDFNYSGCIFNAGGYNFPSSSIPGTNITTKLFLISWNIFRVTIMKDKFSDFIDDEDEDTNVVISTEQPIHEENFNDQHTNSYTVTKNGTSFNLL